MTRRAHTSRPSVGAILIALLGGLALAVLLGLRACSLLDAPTSPARSADDASTESVVSIGYGRTMVAPRGTVASDIIDWLASGADGKRTFEAGGTEFIGNSAELTPRSRYRLERFAVMLQAYHGVRARIVGYSDASGNPAADQRLSEARAHAVMTEIAARGVAPHRLSFEGRGSANPIADNATPAGRALNRRVAVILWRGR